MVLLLILPLVLLFCGQVEEEKPPPNPPKGLPRLVLIITVDQLRGDYLDRFEKIFGKGGFRRFLEESVLFTDAHQDHANTSTGPGHATIVTGAYPAHSGIVNNQWYEENGTRAVYCVGDPEFSVIGHSGTSSPGRSPKNLLVSTLPDWLRGADKKRKVFSISRKDRAAVLMGGNRANAAYWYSDATGNFVTSTYYMQKLPEWLIRFNKKGIPLSYFGQSWAPLRKGKTGESLEIVDTDHGWFDHGFPHAMGSFSPRPNPSFFTRFGRTPLMDEYMGELARELIESEKLGEDSHTDYLSLSFSALDSVGHEYGPHSAEVLDTMVRLDRVLADFFDFLDERVGLENTIIILSSDHGVMDLPEYAATQGKSAHRIDDEDILCIQQKGKQFLRRFGEDEDWFVSGYHFDQAAIRRKNLSHSELEKAAAELFSQCDCVRKVWTRTELEKEVVGEEDPFRGLFGRSFHPDRSPDLIFQMEKYHVGSADTGTSHGSPYRYDTHVPIAFLIPGIEPARIDDRVITADIAPTLAKLLSLEVPNTVDGEDLSPHFALSASHLD
jgi:predicted AlkP superfamily pyrophosphatase or phosphodiesterase